MAVNFYIVEDDRSVARMLKNLITKNELGAVVGMSESGVNAIHEINSTKPDIVLLDYLLPDIDALAVIEKIKTESSPSIIMISEVSSHAMIAKAYQKGIEFFINKPINVVEVISVIKKVTKLLNLQDVLDNFEKAFEGLSNIKPKSRTNSLSLEDRIRREFGQIGILGESGCDDLIKACLFVYEEENSNYKLSDVYKGVTEDNESDNIYAIEQRIRRTITKAFNELASLGSENYYSDAFEKYATLLFDYSELKKQISHIENKNNPSGKVSIRKFLEGMSVLLMSEKN